MANRAASRVLQKRSAPLAGNEQGANRKSESQERRQGTKSKNSTQEIARHSFTVCDGTRTAGYILQVGPRYTVLAADRSRIGEFSSLTDAARALPFVDDGGAL